MPVCCMLLIAIDLCGFQLKQFAVEGRERGLCWLFTLSINMIYVCLGNFHMLRVLRDGLEFVLDVIPYCGWGCSVEP